MPRDFIPGSIDWLLAFRSGAFDKRPPIPWSPPPKAKPVSQIHKPGPMHKHDGKSCAYCGVTMRVGTLRMPTRDHVYPRVAGGTLHRNNMLIVCRPCNGDKGAKTLERFVEWLTKRGDPRAARVAALAQGWKGIPENADPAEARRIIASWEAGRRHAQRLVFQAGDDSPRSPFEVLQSGGG